MLVLKTDSRHTLCVCVGVCVWRGNTVMAQARSISACFLAHSLIYQLPPQTHTLTHFLSPSPSLSPTHTKVVRVHSMVHKDPSELSLAPLCSRYLPSLTQLSKPTSSTYTVLHRRTVEPHEHRENHVWGLWLRPQDINRVTALTSTLHFKYLWLSRGEKLKKKTIHGVYAVTYLLNYRQVSPQQGAVMCALYLEIIVFTF